jgi:putative SOS response-associated peptidase YedK
MNFILRSLALSSWQGKTNVWPICAIQGERGISSPFFGQLVMPDLPPSYNVAPTQQVLAVRERDGRHE